MADVNSNININFNTAAALAQLRSLQAGLSKFHQSLAEGNLAAANAQKGLNAQLLQSIGATGKFSASQVKVAGSTLAFTSAFSVDRMILMMTMDVLPLLKARRTNNFEIILLVDEISKLKSDKYIESTRSYLCKLVT